MNDTDHYKAIDAWNELAQKIIDAGYPELAQKHKPSIWFWGNKEKIEQATRNLRAEFETLAKK